jgi:hypothetical protein
VERSTVSKILKQKSKWLNVPDGEEPHTAKHRYAPIRSSIFLPLTSFRLQQTVKISGD